MRLAALLVGLGVGLGGCHGATEFYENRGFTTAAVYTTSDTRMVTQRPHPLGISGRTVVCTEPGPDVAKALSSAFAAKASGGDGTVTASLEASRSTAEALTELAGRSTALLALRDGLFRTCEAYANGAIGDAAYALVLGRYSQLMATLFLAQDVQGGAVSLGHAESPAPALPQPASSPAPAPANKVAAGLVQSAAWIPPTPIATAPPPRPGARTPPAPSAPMGAPESLLKMQENYLSLDNPQRLLSLLLISCINDSDPTRPANPTGAHSSETMIALCGKLPPAIDAMTRATGRNR